MKEKKNNITELVFIIDRSGSMFKLVNDTIGGFNSLIKKQKKQCRQQDRQHRIQRLQ